ncbi:hypothetical protein LCGC14_2761140, partial [marine sediment metagenome]
MKRLFITVMMTMIVLCMDSVASEKKILIPVTLELSNGRQIEVVLEQGQDYFNIRGTSLGAITIAIDKIKEIIGNAPAGTSPEGVVVALRNEGHTLEGFEETEVEPQKRNTL